jgi:hypothetical protein
MTDWPAINAEFRLWNWLIAQVCPFNPDTNAANHIDDVE